jgi:hypothetical protein
LQQGGGEQGYVIEDAVGQKGAVREDGFEQGTAGAVTGQFLYEGGHAGVVQFPAPLGPLFQSRGGLLAIADLGQGFRRG